MSLKIVEPERATGCEFNNNGCNMPLCEKACCWPPRDWSEINKAICHKHLRELRKQLGTDCETCERLRRSLESHQQSH